MSKRISHSELLNLVIYDPETGHFTSRIGCGRWPAGRRMGRVRLDGYLQIWLNGKHYYSHRLAWLYITGYWPKHQIDHRDCVRANNVWSNLRESSQTQNLANMRKWHKGTSPLKGVHWDATRNCWKSQIKINGINIFLGRFADPLEAHSAYIAAARDGYGEFARSA